MFIETGVTFLSTLDPMDVSGFTPLNVPPRPFTRNIDFSRLSDVSAGFTVGYGRTSFNEATDVLFAEVNLSNNDEHTIRTDQDPILVGVTNISKPSVFLHEPDGYTPERMPYYDVTRLVSDANSNQRLESGETIDGIELRFVDPTSTANPTGVQFSYDLVVLGALNQPPEFVTDPVTDAGVGGNYFYDSEAEDPDQDALVYKLLIGPTTMTIDDTNGDVTWNPVTDEGSHPVVIRATDPEGLFADQAFTVEVVDAATNRPPRFTSLPIVDAYAGVPYVYQSTATDPDGDDLTFSLEMVDPVPPTGFAYVVGLATWTPTVADIGNTYPVELIVDDGRGGSDTQFYQIFVHPDPANRPPIIISEPIEYFEMAGDRSPFSGNVDPHFIERELDDGEVFLREGVRITLGGGGTGAMADIIFVVDESGSMELQHEWIDGDAGQANGMIHALDAALTAAGVDINPQYGLVGYGADGGNRLGHSHLFTGNSFWASTPTDFINGRLEPLETSGGYEAIDFALRTYPFRDNAAVNIILITDEDRDGLFNPDITKDSIRTALEDKAALINVVVNSSYDIDPSLFLVTNTLGITGLPPTQTSYLADGMGSFTIDTVETPVPLSNLHAGLTEVDYDDLAWQLGGATWDLNILQGGGLDAESFTEAFVDVKKDEIQSQLLRNVILVPDVAGFDVVISPNVFPNVLPGQTATFDVLFTGDGLSHGFDLQFIDQDTGTLLGSIPVSINDVYTYDVEAIDPDDDPITFSLEVAPPWALMPNQSTGIIVGTPPPGDNEYDFIVRASDDRGGKDEQPFSVIVRYGQLNAEPEITSTAPTEAIAGLTYYYGVEATDEDQDALRYLLDTVAPPTMSIDPTTGLITWTPDGNDVGVTPTFMVIVQDGRSGQDSQPITITVAASEPVNNEPEFVSTPIQVAIAGETYVYEAKAVDPDAADRLTYDLVIRPEGMVVDSDSGIVYWQPRESQVGEEFAVLQVRDGRGGWDLQPIELTVISNNEPPEITSTPVTVANQAAEYRYQVTSTDPNGDEPRYFVDPISYDRGMRMDIALGLLTWPAASVVAGFYQITVAVDDMRGGVDFQTFDLLVGPNSPPTLDLVPNTVVPLGNDYVQQLMFDDPEDGMNLTVTVDDASVARGMEFQPANTLIWTPYQLGDFPVTVTVEDTDGATATSQFIIRVVDPTAPNEPPDFTSEPRGPAFVDRIWSYPVTADDPNGDNVTFSLDQAPIGASIDPATDVLTWTPTEAGLFDIIITATDDGTPSRSTTQTIRLPVIANSPPFITKWPAGSILVSQVFNFTFEAVDPNGDAFTFSLEDATGDMMITPSGGFSWNPAPTGSYVFKVVVTDVFGASSRRLVELEVIPAVNGAPTVDQAHRSTIQAGQTYLHQIQASDPDDDPLVFTLDTSSSPPAALELGPSGLIRWTTTADDVTVVGTPASFDVKVTDGVIMTPITVSFQIDVTLAAVSNAAPVITSRAIEGAVAGEIYRYQATATDADNDSVFWSLDSGPDGLAVDELTGLLTWAPTDADIPALHPVVLRASDPYGQRTTQEFTITVRSTNLGPQILSVAPVQAKTGVEYGYDVVVVDPEGDPITLTLTNPPPGMEVDFDNPLRIEWPSPGASTGTITLTAQTPDGQSDTETFQITVVTNTRPMFTSTPIFYAVQGQPYQYQAVADDPGDIVTYNLNNSPSVPGDMTIAGGLITWNVGASEAGNTYWIGVTATDGALSQTQVYLLTVEEDSNTAPTISTLPDPINHTLGTDFFFDVLPYVSAPNPAGDFHTYSLDPSAPTGMTIDERTGQITWAAADVVTVGSPFAVTVTVTDKFGESASDSTQVVVAADTTPPTVEVTVSDSPVLQGTAVTFFVNAVDDVGIHQRKLFVRPPMAGADTEYTVALNGTVVLTLDELGDYQVHATATDTSNLTTTSTTITVSTFANIGASPIVEILAPLDLTVIDEPFEVIGSVRDPDFDGAPSTDPVTYTVRLLPLLPGTGIAPIDLGTFGGRRTNEPLGAVIDPTLAPSGPYRLEITADDGTSFPTTVTRVVSLETELELGNFEISFTDMVIPIAGLPITVVRSYDSARAHIRGEFGYGWRLELSNTDLSVDIDPDSGIQFSQTAPYRDGTRVTVTLPDGTTETFAFHPIPVILIPFSTVPSYYLPNFVSLNGTSELFVGGGLTLNSTGSGTYYVQGVAFQEYNPIDFGNAFLLITRTGLEFLIRADTGDLAEIADPNGNTLTFNGNSIASSSGVGVQFSYGAGGIRAITGPDGKQVTYGYDPLSGDLISVTNRLMEQTTFKYEDAARDHYLTGIVDSRGVTLLTVLYDPATGRLTGLTDASGVPANLDYSLDLGDGRYLESVSDSAEGSTEVIRDRRGNTLRQIRHLKVADSPLRFEYLITLFRYDSLDRLTHRSVPFTITDPSVRLDFVPAEADLVWAQETGYDELGNVTTIIDAAGGLTAFSNYDSFGNPGTIVDAGTGVTHNVYDDDGNLLRTADAEGGVTEFTYGNFGQLNQITQLDALGMPITLSVMGYNADTGVLEAVTDAAGFTQSFGYNQYRELTSSTYVWVDPDSMLPNKTVTTFTDRDEEGRVTGTRQEVAGLEIWNTVTDYTAGLVTSTTDRFGLTTENIYDTRGNLIETRTESEDESGVLKWIVSRTVYDPLGRVEYTIDPHKESYPIPVPVAAPGTHTFYDTLGRVIKTERLDSILISLIDDPVQTDPQFLISNQSNVGAILSTNETVYDAVGRVDHTIQSADGLTLISKSVYDDAGRMIESIQDTDGDLMTAADQLLTQFVYDTAGRQTRVIDALGHESRFEYDLLGRQTAVILPNVMDSMATVIQDHLRTETVYDEFGRRVLVRENISQVTPGNDLSINATQVRETHYEYDTSGRLTAVVLPEIDDPDSPGTPTHPRYEYTYDIYGN